MLKKKNILRFSASVASGNEEGTIWDVTVVQAGFAPAKPHLFIAKEALSSSVNVFDGSRVYANRDADYFGHVLDSSKKGTRDIVGVLKGGYIQGDELRYQLHILPSAQWLKENSSRWRRKFSRSKSSSMRSSSRIIIRCRKSRTWRIMSVIPSASPSKLPKRTQM